MEMSIDEARYLIEHHKPNDINNAYELGEDFCVAIETMKKFQKIQEIVKNTQQLCSYGSAFIDIREVIEDGKID